MRIKDFSVHMEAKNKGVEFEVRSPDGASQLGDMVVSKTGITWCKGKTTQAKGKKVRWEKLIEWIEHES